MKKNKLTHDQWITLVLSSYVKKHKPEEAEVEHVKDFLRFNSTFKVSTRLSYLAVKDKAEKWVKKLNEKNKNLKESGRVELAFDFKNGLKLLRLANQTAKDWEGKQMGHCVASYRDHEGIYSLRDEFELPHCTLEISKGTAVQIKGKANKEVALKYHPFIIKSLALLECKLKPTDLKNIGYREVKDSVYEILKNHFSGLMDVKVDSVKFINYSSPLKLNKKFQVANKEIFDLLLNKMDCPEAFKELLFLECPDKNLREDFIGIILRNYTHRFSVVKSCFEASTSVPDVVIKNLEMLTNAAKGNNFDSVKYIYNKQKITLAKRKLDQLLNPVLTEALTAAFANRNSEIALFLLNCGAQLSPKSIRDFLAWGVDVTEPKFLETLLPLNVVLNDQDFDAVMECIQLKQKDFDVLEKFTRARRETAHLRKRLVLSFNASKDERIVKLLISKFKTEDDKFVEDIIEDTTDLVYNLLPDLEAQGINIFKENYLLKAIQCRNKKVFEYLVDQNIFYKVMSWNLLAEKDFISMIPFYSALKPAVRIAVKAKAKEFNFLSVLTAISLEEKKMAPPPSQNRGYLKVNKNGEDFYEDQDGNYWRTEAEDGRMRNRRSHNQIEMINDELDRVDQEIRHHLREGRMASPSLYARRKELVERLQYSRRILGVRGDWDD